MDTDGRGLLVANPTVAIPSKVHNVVSQFVSSDPVPIRVHRCPSVVNTFFNCMVPAEERAARLNDLRVANGTVDRRCWHISRRQ
jgi:hypothetical protein